MEKKDRESARTHRHRYTDTDTDRRSHTTSPVSLVPLHLHCRNGTVYKDNHIRVDLASSDARLPPTRTVFVGNLPIGEPGAVGV